MSDPGRRGLEYKTLGAEHASLCMTNSKEATEAGKR